ncbi:MAG TPA: hypothetical protein VK689_11440 [Armatimonadota bacterium]|nr:hypothetical protein [Armatimonadota bacterium]
MDHGKRLLAAVACGVLAVYPAAIASAYLAMFLFSINAPESDRLVERGWGFFLYYSLVAGGITGGVTVSGLVSGNSRYCTGMGAVTTIAILAAMCLDSWSDRWQGFDMLAFPLLLSVLLFVWGLWRHRTRGKEAAG